MKKKLKKASGGNASFEEGEASAFGNAMRNATSSQQRQDYPENPVGP